jgi:MATE family multidrug resistance protein
VIESALKYLPYCALAPVAGFAAWQLDGIFIGTTRTREMRNAAIAAVALYIAAHYVITPKFGKDGIWIAFLFYYVARAVTLSFYYPNIRKQMEPSNGY